MIVGSRSAGGLGPVRARRDTSYREGIILYELERAVVTQAGDPALDVDLLELVEGCLNRARRPGLRLFAEGRADQPFEVGALVVGEQIESHLFHGISALRSGGGATTAPRAGRPATGC